MKKTISINISGVVFNIEEDAYDDLRQYLDTISGYFTDSDGRDEIMTDIEARIAGEIAHRDVTIGRPLDTPRRAQVVRVAINNQA